MNSSVYLDYNATTPLDPSVLDVITKTFKEAWANPGSNHKSGQIAATVVSHARQEVARMIDANTNDILFSSGGTEINNWIIQISIDYFYNQLRQLNDSTIIINKSVGRPHIITTNIEHDSIRIPLEKLSFEKKIDVSYVPISSHSGAVEIERIINEIRINTCLVTVMLANNETGAIQPVDKICQEIKAINKSKNRVIRILTHTDAAQAIGKIPVSVRDLQVDYMTIVGHKFYGPRIGAFYVHQPGKETPITPLFYGGGQERQLRPGTENVPLIAGLGKASQLVSDNLDVYVNHMKEMRDYLLSQLKSTFGEKININNNFPHILPNTCNISFVGFGLDGYKILGACRYLEASVGAACHSKKNVSKILLASGFGKTLARNAIRLSVGRETTKSEIDTVINDLRQAEILLKTKLVKD